MASQALAHRMMETSELQRLRFQLVAAEFVTSMGTRIRERRDELGLSRADVAREMPGKTSENQIYRWENAKHVPNPDTLEALAKVLKCDVAYFMAGAPDKSKTPDPFPASTNGSQANDLGERLERIERKLDELLLRTPASTPQPQLSPEPPAELVQPPEAAQTTPRNKQPTRRRRAAGSQQRKR